MLPEEISHWGPLETWSLPEHLVRRGEERPDAPFIQKGDAPPLTYAEVLERTRVMAGRLAAVGVEFQDRVVTMIPTSIEAVIAWFGVNFMGAVDVPVNTAYVGQSLVHAVNLSEARVVVTTGGFVPRLAEVWSDLTHVETVVLMGGESGTSLEGAHVVEVDAIQGDAWDGDPAPSYRDLASVVLTSGTTGPAKGVLIPHAQAYSYAWLSVDGFQQTEDDVFLCVHPLFHVGGKGAITCTLLTGGRVVMTDGFNATTWIDDVRRHGATLTIGHGPMLEMVHAQPERDDDADNPLRAFMAAPFPRSIAEDFERRFAAKGLEVYGMTEVSTCVWHPIDEPLRLGAAGRPRDELFEIQVVDPDTDMPVEAGEIGEITVRPLLPWTTMQGYMSMPEETIEAWRNLWFHTGDSGHFDEDGYLYFVDRMRDRIRRRAENISSYDIEVAAGSYPGVIERAVIGVASDYEADDDIKLFIVADEPIDFEDLTRHLVRCLPHFMVPRYIELLDALPRTPTNKVRKEVLRDRGNSEATWDRKATGVSVRELANSVRGAGGPE